MGRQPKDKATAEWMKKTQQQDFAHADMADPQTLNAIIWFACTGNGSNMPQSAELPAYQAMRLGILGSEEAPTTGKKKADDD
jgi:hypothetical protein